LRIAIIGAGLCGLATAGFLARAGHRVEVLERTVEPRPMGAGLLLQPPGAAVLDQLGALDQVARDAARITRLYSRSASGGTLLDLDYADLAPGLHGLGLTRPAIWAALMDAAHRAGARLLPGVPVATVDPAGVLTLESGERRAADLIVVAAGTHTALRIGGTARPYPWGCLWTTVRLPPDWPRDVLLQRCLGTRFMAGILPTGTVAGSPVGALYWSIRNDAVAACRAAPIATWRDGVTRVWPEAGPLLRGLTHADLEHARYRDIHADPPFTGRMVVVGDAAHGTSPQLGQGTTQALRDAAALAEALSADADLPAQLTAYWSARKRRIGYYRLASRALTPAFQSAIPGLGPARDLLAGPIGRIPFVKRQALLTLAGLKAGLFTADAMPMPAEALAIA